MAVNEDLVREFQKIGSITFLTGLNNSHSGNLSVRVGNKMYVTRRGSMLGYLQEDDVIELDLFRIDSNLMIASTESRVHAKIYIHTEALAIVHCHSVATTALSMVRDEIIPIDVEGGYFIRKAPVVSFEFSSGSKEMEDALPEYLKNYKAVVVKGHGVFACAQTLEEALFSIHSLEHSCRMIEYLENIGIDSKSLEKPSYGKW